MYVVVLYYSIVKCDGGAYLENLKKNELLILSHFRRDARKNLTKISRTTGIPVSTIFDKLKLYEGSLIKKHTSILDFNVLGYDVRVHLIIKVKKEEKEKLQNYLMKNNSVNTFYKINNGFDFMVEGIFKNMNDYYEFIEKLELLGVQKRHEFFILQELRREAFLNDEELLDLM